MQNAKRVSFKTENYTTGSHIIILHKEELCWESETVEAETGPAEQFQISWNVQSGGTQQKVQRGLQNLLLQITANAYQQVSGGPSVKNSKILFGLSMLSCQKHFQSSFQQKTKPQTSVSIFGYFFHQACEPIIYYHSRSQPQSGLYNCSQLLPDPNYELLNNKADRTTYCSPWSPYDPTGLWSHHCCVWCPLLPQRGLNYCSQLLLVSNLGPLNNKTYTLSNAPCTTVPICSSRPVSPSYTTTAVCDAACNLWAASTIAVSLGKAY